MILPNKHIKLAESIFGLSSIVLSLIDSPISIDDLWVEFQKINNTDFFPAYHDLDNFMLALNFLFIIGSIEQVNGGGVKLCG
jgi:hypothetical protein